MSTQKERRLGNEVEKQTSNESSEIFVLPPDLLMKLGINLDGIKNKEDLNTRDSDFVQYDNSEQSIMDFSHEEVLPSPSNESKSTITGDGTSILETANLMKKSVFLSPIFSTPINSNVTEKPYELESMNDQKIVNDCEELTDVHVSLKILENPNISGINQNVDTNNFNYDLVTNNFDNTKHKSINEELDNKSSNLTNIKDLGQSKGQTCSVKLKKDCLINNNNIHNKNLISKLPLPGSFDINKMTTLSDISTTCETEQKTDQKISNDRTIGNVFEPTIFREYTHGESLKDSNNKEVNFESFQNVEVSSNDPVHNKVELNLLDHLGCLSNDKSRNKPKIDNSQMIRQDNNHVLDKHNLISASFREEMVIQNTLGNEIISNENNTSQNVAKVKDSNMMQNIVSNGSAHSNDHVCDIIKNKTSEAHKQVTYSCSHIDNTTVKSIDPMAKVPIIAKYLNLIATKIAEKKRYKQNNPSKVKKIIYSKNKTVASKLCIQGVEKPGGDTSKKVETILSDINDMVVYKSDNKKTYGHHTKMRKVPNYILNYKSEQEISKYVRDIDLCSPSLVVCSSKSHCFCNCYDFGCLWFDGKDSTNYQHIHFDKDIDIDDISNFNICWKSIEDNELSPKNDMDCEDERKSFEIQLEDESSNHEEVIPLLILYEELSSNSQKQIADAVSNSEVERKTPEIQFEDKSNDHEQDISSLTLYEETSSNNEKQIVDIVSNLEDGRKTFEIQLEDNTSNHEQVIPLLILHEEMSSNSEKQIVDEVSNCEVERKTPEVQLEDKLNDHEQDIPSLTSCEEMISNNERLVNDNNTQIDISLGECSNSNVANREIIEETKSYIRGRGSKRNRDSIESHSSGDLPLSKWKKTYKDGKILSQISEKKHSKAIQDNLKESIVDYVINSTDKLNQDNIKCGVCSVSVDSEKWLEHIQNNHNYIAWKEGECSIDVNATDDLLNYLRNISTKLNGLTCSGCGLTRKKANTYLKHVKNCKWQNRVDKNLDTSTDPMETWICDVCSEDVPSNQWFDHIQNKHNYLAWKRGEAPINLKSVSELKIHLKKMLEIFSILTCRICGYVRRQVAPYLTHIASCDTPQNLVAVIGSAENISFDKEHIVSCALCKTKISFKNWETHSRNEHYNLAWIEGLPPINIRDAYEVNKYLTKYKEHGNKLVCKNCGTSRASTMGFYAHVLTCEKTEEEIEAFKETCNICNVKYLCIYRQQHMIGHRDKNTVVEDQVKAVTEEKTNVGEPSGRRRAAEKARAVIQEYKNNNLCSNCNTTGARLDCNKCTSKNTEGDSSDTDVTVEFGDECLDESDGSDYNSMLSDEEQNEKKPKSNNNEQSDTVRVKSLANCVTNIRKYISKCNKDLCETNLSQKDLFPEWRHCEYQFLDDDKRASYLPLLQKSCQVQFQSDQWIEYELFESRRNDVGQCIFLGGIPQCMAWAPPSTYTEWCGDDEYLAISCHRSLDEPEIGYDQIFNGPNLIQIWNFKNFDMSQGAHLALGIAHDFGAVWSMAWCPSGARERSRLGLLAVACSNGSVYILSIPSPSSLPEGDKLIIKLNPVVELRFCMDKDRRTYQATGVDWSLLSGHSLIAVGYASGYVALFDVNVQSPILRDRENGVTVIYPYHDDLTFNSAVKDVRLYPSAPLLGAASATGAAVRARGPAAAAARAQSSVAGAIFTPHWPSLLFSSDDPSVNQRLNELDLSGVGRHHMGGVRRLGACWRCGRVAGFSPPALRVARPGPPRADANKRILALVDMVPLVQKKKSKKVNDELETKIEPFTYEDAVKKYGLKVTVESNTLPPPKPDEVYPNRYPLAEVTALAFCLSSEHHNKIAVATHAGFLIVI